MRVNVVRIGNSRGIRIPKMILEQCHLAEEVELDVKGNRLIVRPLTRPRKNWEEAFRKMRDRGDDALLDRASLPTTRWDRREWQW